MGRMMKYMMLSGFLKGNGDGPSGLMAMMLMGGKDNIMDDLFETDEEEEKKEA